MSCFIKVFTVNYYVFIYSVNLNNNSFLRNRRVKGMSPRLERSEQESFEKSSKEISFSQSRIHDTRSRFIEMGTFLIKETINSYCSLKQ